MLLRVLLCILLMIACTSGCVFAQGKKNSSDQEDFCWPLENFRYSLNAPTGGWLAPRKGGAWHLGVDMFTAVGQPVRAIADGVVYEISTSGWGAGNVAVMIRHRLADGRSFVALYGHIRNSRNLRVGERIRACQSIGTIGPYRYAGNSHLHFGVVAPGKLPRPPYGTSKRADHNNFIDPVKFLTSQKRHKASAPEAAHKEVPAPASKAQVAAPPQSKAAPKKLSNPQPVKKKPQVQKKATTKAAAETSVPVLKTQGKSSAR
jgi:hypothetical protein